MTDEKLIRALQFAWVHASAEEEETVVWVAEKIAERISTDPAKVDAFVFAATGQHVYA